MEVKSKYEVMSWTPEECEDDMLYDLENGKERGVTCHIEEFDQCWSWRKSECTVWTGMSNEGKSEFVKFLQLLKVLEEGWKFTLNAPEDYPAKEYFDSMISTISGKTTDKHNVHNELISKELYRKCLNLIKGKFNFRYIRPPYNTVENCLEDFQKIHDKTPQDGFLMDPLVKFQKSKNAPERPEEYSAYVATLVTDFARVNNTIVNLVIHQLTPKMLESTGLYSKPNMYTIRGGGAIADSVDNINYVWRPLYAKDKLATDVTTGSQKIKKQKLVGIPGDVQFAYNRKTSRYTYIDGQDVYNFSKHLK